MRRLASRPQFLIVTLAFGCIWTSFVDEFTKSCEGWTSGVPAGPVAAKTLLRDHASNSFDDAGAIEVTIAMEDLAMKDDLMPGAGPFELLRLIRVFLRLADPGRRGRVLDLAEQLAKEAGSATAGATFAATEAPFVEPAPISGPTE
ncbi:MAG: hypothetical protein QHD01_36665 [Bradyrhizobium sp.]|uniref:hypothetical protein n=1 Tax=Bradyrhizobium sp. TaxID=376 RepID=UPI0029B2CB2B|nr:hypothetical protein [Bradyrhizobium sp.]MDX3972106.1 hypothetical protein [Bradyrhizobium sp.]